MSNMNDMSAVAVVLSTGTLCCLRFINMSVRFTYVSCGTEHYGCNGSYYHQ